MRNAKPVSRLHIKESVPVSIPGIAFLGGTRYSHPLNATHAKKFDALKSLGTLYIIGFSVNWLPQRFTQQQVGFYLLPQLPLAMLRYGELTTLGWTIALWLIWRRGVRILVAQSPYEGVAAALAKTIAAWFGCRVVLVVESHGDFEGYLFLQRSVPFPGLYRWVMRHAARFALDRADLVRSVSQATRQQLAQWAPQTPMFQFVAWTDMKVFLQAGREGELGAGERGSGGAGEPVEIPYTQMILYAGVLIPRKGVIHLVNAFAQVAAEFPNARLVLIGREANGEYAIAVQDTIHKLGVSDRVQRLPHVPQAELAAYMAEAAVFVLPSLSEGLGLVVVEAMATGTPVVGSAIEGIPEMVQDEVNGFLVPPGDEAALADRLRWLLTHPLEAKAMGDRARDFAQQFCSAALHVQGYRQIVEAAQAILDDQEPHHAPSAF